MAFSPVQVGGRFSRLADELRPAYEQVSDDVLVRRSFLSSSRWSAFSPNLSPPHD